MNGSVEIGANDNSKRDKATKKHKKRSKSRKLSDPTVTNISNLLSLTLNLVSPKEKPSDKDSSNILEDINLDNSRKEGETAEVSIVDISIHCTPPHSPKLEPTKISSDNIEAAHEGSVLVNTPSNENKSKTQSRNAFEFMMESSRKSIGHNSPGKDPDKDTCIPTGEDKQKLLARKYLFEKWANIKGNKRCLFEDKEREVHVKQVLEKRAKKMKKMLSIKEKKNEKQKVKVKKILSDSEDSEDIGLSKTSKDDKRISQINGSILFLDNTQECEVIKNRKGNCDERDDENNKKQKVKKENIKEIHVQSKDHINMKENSLHNFLGITSSKSDKRKFIEDDDDFVPTKNDNINRENIIKIKMFSPTIFQRKRKVVSKNDSEENDEFEPKVSYEKNKCKKMKIKHSKDINDRNNDSKNMLLLNSTNSIKNCKSFKDPTSKLSTAKNISSKSKKPHRNLVKNPKPLVVDVDESSNDSVLVVQSDSKVSVRHRLRRSARCKDNSLLTYIVNSDSEDSNGDKKNNKLLRSNGNVAKLAPIFLQNKQKSKIDPQVLEARKQFLRSGIPEALKKNIEKQQSFENIEPNYFPEVSHIQQKHVIENGKDYWNLPIVKLNTVDLAVTLPKTEALKKGTLNNFDDVKNKQHPMYAADKPQNLKLILLEIKKNNPEYPVFKSFRLLKQKTGKLQIPVKELQKIETKKSRGRKSKKQKTEKAIKHQINDNNCVTTMMWSEKYKANTADDLLGNHSSTLELRKWLQSWATISENGSTILKRRDSSSSEFDCDSQSHDSTMCPANAVIVHGPHGVGKTMTIYALCNDLGINVLELNASSKRTGKRLMQELQEATQSHQVRNNENLDLNDFFKLTSNKKHENTSQSKDQLIKNPNMCLLLVEDVDIVFEQDDGFLNGLIQLLLTSKRPIILVANDISSPNLQKIISQYSLIEFSPLTPKVMTVWLQILCLIEGCFINKESLCELLDWNKGDIRRTLLQLQFWVETGGGTFVNTPLNNTEETKANFDEEFPNDDSHLSILGETCENDSGAIAIHSNCISTFVDHSQTSLDKIWWNLYKQSRLKGNAKTVESNPTVKANELEQFHEHFDTLSLIDKSHVNCGKVENSSLSAKNSLLEVKDSIELLEVYTGCNHRKDFIEEWSHTLLTHCTNLYPNQGILDMGLPSTEDKRWEKKQRSCKAKFMEAAPHSCFVDKKGFALDYYPTLRTISRSEKVRCANIRKRKNRFFSYLRALGLYFNDSVTNTACRVLNPNSHDCKKT